MGFKLFTIGLTALVFANWSLANPVIEPHKTVCYYESWAHWRADDGKMDLADIDNAQCTHLVYSFLGIKRDTFELEITDPYLMNDLHDIERFAQYKGQAKALIAVGGPSASGEFAAMAATDRGRSAFVHSVMDFMEQYNYDGIMVHWFGQIYHSEDLVALLDKFHEEKFTSRYTLAIAVPANGAADTITYDVAHIAELVDFITVLTFDNVIVNPSSFLWQLRSADWYHQHGAPRSKLVLTMPLFARTRVTDEKGGYIRDGPAGSLSRVVGYLSFNELCSMILRTPEAFTVVINPEDYSASAVYSLPVDGNAESQFEHFYFENRRTLALKARNITASGYGGIAVYALDNDDFHGLCGLGKWPLMRAINENYVASQQN